MHPHSLIAKTFLWIVLCCPHILRAQQNKDAGEIVPAKEVSSIFGDSVKKAFRIAIRHQDSDLDEGRRTEVDKGFQPLPQKLKDAISAKIATMNKENMAIFGRTTF